jgi:hypothetical protein
MDMATGAPHNSPGNMSPQHKKHTSKIYMLRFTAVDYDPLTVLNVFLSSACHLLHHLEFIFKYMPVALFLKIPLLFHFILGLLP